MYRKMNAMVIVLMIGLVVVLTGCNSLSGTFSVVEGTLKLVVGSQENGNVDMQTVSDHIQLSKYLVTATKDGTVHTEEVAYTGDTQEIIINNLAVGTWDISVVAMDENNYHCYSGTGTTAVVADTLTTVEIPLYLMDGNLDVTVKFPTDVIGSSVDSGIVKLIDPRTGTNVSKDLIIGEDGYVDFGAVQAGTWYMEVELYGNGTQLAWGSGSMTVLPDRNNTAIIEFTDIIQGGDLKIIVVVNESPSDPTGLSGTYNNGSVVLNWNANPESNIAGYVVYRAPSETDFKKILTYTLINDTTFTDTDVEAGKSYYYWIQVYDTNGYSSEYSVACVVDTSVTATSPTMDLSSYTEVLYVNLNTGDDVNGDGSLEAPYQSLHAASLNVIQDNTVVYINGPGTYPLPNGLISLLKTDLRVDYIVDPAIRGDVIFDIQYTITTISMSKFNNFVGVIFQRSGGGNGDFYATFTSESFMKINFYNCVFDEGPITPTAFPIMVNNVSGTWPKDLYYYNCIFVPVFVHIDDAAMTCKGHFINSAFAQENFTIDSYNLQQAATYDSSYQILTTGWENVGVGLNPDGTQAHIGVYGGANAWGQW